MFKVLHEDIYFKSAEEAQDYAKKNLGTAIVRSDKASASAKSSSQITPRVIYEYLNEHVISQEDAKKDIAMALYYHHLKITNKNIKSNDPVMLIGPTGSGKTFIVQKACEFMDVLFIHVDTASMTPEGFTGYGISDLGRDILELAKGDKNRASNCVVFFDEMDKLFNSKNEHSQSVSRQLLRLIEGSKLKVSNKNILLNSYEELDTSNMQFILGGAFQWIFDKKEERKQYSIYHLSNQTREIDTQITLNDLYKEDIPKELLGRMGSIINLKKLTADDYYEILTNSKSSPLFEFIKKIELHGDRVEISDETIYDIAKMAEKSELGTRAIKQKLKCLFNEALFDAPGGRAKVHRF